MEIYPAIDLINGRCVRLSEGDYNAQTNYDIDPLVMAASYKQAGARWLHLVDLDGAKDPAARQKKLIAALVEKSGLKVQTGGGVRSAVDVKELLELGVARIIIGSLCVRDVKAVMSIFEDPGPEKIVLALDVRGDFEKGFFVATAGWQDTSTSKVDEVIRQYRGTAKHILCTDISKDGKLKGPNVQLYKYLCTQYPEMQFQASGGVSQLDDLNELKAGGAAGAIIGKALYEKKFTLDEALRKVA
jgi:phosphoribosylformimino-5-aminoimidazole carboxamide ribotide isomerase